MCRKLIFIWLIIISIIPVFGQLNRTRTWVFGDGIGMYFSSGGSIDTFSGILRSDYPNYEGTGVYNDSEGRLMYYV